MLHICQASRDGSFFFPYAPSIGMRFTPVRITLIQINSMKIHTKKIKLLLLRVHLHSLSRTMQCQEKPSKDRREARTHRHRGGLVDFNMGRHRSVCNRDARVPPLKLLCSNELIVKILKYFHKLFEFQLLLLKI
ncbi:hypothetical protein EVAR_59607_1 [Eumeta japonica]|uniref:Uncharacterized protein n=1 Tax=Eumeta variegata TaxID=151549 RepID=A0A4C1ZB26_EUMVA|nr:hypothetical protein EVAR_59607_1 [Eumeta japonica]